MKFKKILKKYSFLIGFVLLYVVILQLDLNSLLESFLKTDYLLATIGIMFVVPIALIKSWRWNYLKKLQGIKYKLLDSFLIYNVGFLIGIITPGKVGELVKIYYLKNNDCSTGKSLVSVILDRFLDLAFLLVFGYLGIIFTLRELRTKTNLIFGLLLVSIIALIIVYKRGWHKILFKKIFYRLINQEYQNKWQTNFSDFLDGLKGISFQKYLPAITLTIIGWLVYYCQIYILALSVNLDIPVIQLAIAVTVSGLVTLLPISLLGIGTREVLLIVLLKPYTNDVSAIIIMSQLILLANIAGGGLGAISWKFKPLPLNNIFNKKANKIQ